MRTNGAGQGLLAEDWDVMPAAPSCPAAAPTTSESPSTSVNDSHLPGRTGYGLVPPKASL